MEKQTDKELKKEKRHLLCKKKDGLWNPCYLEVVENIDGSISFIGDEWAERKCYAYPKQVEKIKRILYRKESRQGMVKIEDVNKMIDEEYPRASDVYDFRERLKQSLKELGVK